MTAVNSVLGLVDTASLGFTLMHEHLLVSSAGVPQGYPGLLDEGFMDQIVDGLVQARNGGVRTVVDATTLDLGRDVKVLVEASRRSGVNVIAVTGWWLDVPRHLLNVSADDYAEMFIHDIRRGIDGTDVKAGLLKSASDMAGVSPTDEKVLRGVARAHAQTGVPIMLHSYSPGQVGRRQVAILREEGVDLTRVKVDHSNDTTDLEYLAWLIGQGCYLGMDRYPGRNTSPLARTRTLKALMDAGHGDKLLPSHDWALARIKSDVTQEERRSRNPHGLQYIKRVVYPQLEEMGVSEADRENLFVDNPKRFFEGGVS
jgi:phosphotriesterase-related protein